MKRILLAIAILLSVQGFSQTLYIPNNPDSLLLPVQVNGAVRKVYVGDLTKGKQSNLNIINAKDYGAKGDGTTDDAAALMSWLNAGNNLYLPAGTYLVNSEVVSTATRNGVTIFADKGAKIICATSFNQFTPVLRLANITNLVIRDLTIEANSSRNHVNAGTAINNLDNLRLDNCTNVVIDNCSFNDVSRAAIWASDCPNTEVKSCKIVDTYGYGIVFGKNSSYLKIHHNYITQKQGIDTDHTNQSGTTFPNIAILVGQATDNVIGVTDHVWIEANYVEGFYNTGSKTEGCNYVTYNDNTFVKSGKDAIKIQGRGGGTETVKYFQITNNKCDRLTPYQYDGTSLIQAWNAEHGVISNNICKGGVRGTSDGGSETGIKVFASYAGFKVNDITISDNIIDSVGAFGIYLITADNIKIHNNKILNWGKDDNGNSDAIRIDNTSNMHIIDNETAQTTKPSGSGAGIRVMFSSNPTVTNNTITKPGGYGIMYNNLVSGQFADLSFNKINTTGQGGIYMGGGDVATINMIRLNYNMINSIAYAGAAVYYDASATTIKTLSIVGTNYDGNGSVFTLQSGTIPKFLTGGNIYSSTATAPTYTVTPATTVAW